MPGFDHAGSTGAVAFVAQVRGVLLIHGVPERAVMGIIGWSHSAMATRYQHVTTAIQRDIAGRVGGLIWNGSQDGRQPDRDWN